MTVEQFDPSTSNSNKSQTTTLDIPSKMIEEQHQTKLLVLLLNQITARAKGRIRVSLGCPKNLVDS